MVPSPEDRPGTLLLVALLVVALFTLDVGLEHGTVQACAVPLGCVGLSAVCGGVGSLVGRARVACLTVALCTLMVSVPLTAGLAWALEDDDEGEDDDGDDDDPAMAARGAAALAVLAVLPAVFAPLSLASAGRARGLSVLLSRRRARACVAPSVARSACLSLWPGSVHAGLALSSLRRPPLPLTAHLAPPRPGGLGTRRTPRGAATSTRSRCRDPPQTGLAVV